MQGKCNWCGKDGLCCKMGSFGNGCDGTFGGESGHICALKPGKLKFIFFIYNVYSTFIKKVPCWNMLVRTVGIHAIQHKESVTGVAPMDIAVKRAQ